MPDADLRLLRFDDHDSDPVRCRALARYFPAHIEPERRRMQFLVAGAHALRKTRAG